MSRKPKECNLCGMYKTTRVGVFGRSAWHVCDQCIAALGGSPHDGEISRETRLLLRIEHLLREAIPGVDGVGEPQGDEVAA